MAQRLLARESRIEGLTPAEAASGGAAADLESLAPIDDIRASAVFRRHAALVLVTAGWRLLVEAMLSVRL